MQRKPSDNLPRPGLYLVGPCVDVTTCLRLAHKIASGYCQRWAVCALHSEDVHQAALEGLVKAGWLFRPARGFRFTTYASYAIRTSILLWMDGHGHVDRETNYMREKGIPAAVVVSLSGRAADGVALAEAIPDIDRGHAEELERVDRARSAKRQVQLLRRQLPAREAAVIRSRFILGQTLAMIANKQGISKVRVQQIERRAMGMMRRQPKRTTAGA